MIDSVSGFEIPNAPEATPECLDGFAFLIALLCEGLSIESRYAILKTAFRVVSGLENGAENAKQ